MTTRYAGFRSQGKELARETFYYIGYTISSFIQPTSVESASIVVENTDLDNHIAQLKKRLPSKDFSIVVQPPFVVIGDEPSQSSRNALRERSRGCR